MASRIKYPVGIQTFKKIIDNNYLYVDKTALIYSLVHRAEYVFLSRPRRFGKSLLMSTLEAYFKGERELFKDLAIFKLEKHWESYPVFRFDLSGENYDDLQRVVSRITRCFKKFEKEYSLQLSGDSIADKFIDLIEQAYERYNKQVVILIDEYDKPMLDCLHDDDLQEKVRAELRGFYSVIKLSDEYIRFAMLTGVTKFGKVSVFSGLNNLKDISMWTEFNALCGISEMEFQRDFNQSVEEFASNNNLSPYQTWREFKALYDGYRFEWDGEDIYNPYSVLSAFDSNKLKKYWYATGSSSYLIKLIKRHSYMLANLEGARRKELALSDISDISRDFVPLLYQAGYLTIKDYDHNTHEYILGFPNKEVYEGFWEALADYFFRNQSGESSFNIYKFLSDVNEGRPQDFMKRLGSLFSDTESEHESNKEVHFQNMMAIACKMLGLAVRTEVHSSAGRCDMQIETPSYLYIFEFKVNGNVEEAMKQIYEKDYAGRYRMDSRKIFLIAANFSTSTRTFTSPVLIETLN